MLLYHNRSVLRLIFARHGSIIRVRSIILGLIIATCTLFLAYLIDIESEFAPKIPHHYGMMLIGGVVSFALVYRMNLGWARYWEAIMQQHFMYSKWADAYSQFFSFAQVSIADAQKQGGIESARKVQRINDCLDRVERNFGLLSAMTGHRLTCGDNERMERRTTMGASWNDRVVMRQKLHITTDGTGAADLPSLTDYDFKTRKSMSQNLLEENWDFVYRIKQIPSTDEITFLREAKDRVSAVMYWIIHDLSQISSDLTISPPIQSRMYQELSNGMLGFNNSLKIADVPFPFPYAHLLTWMLIAFSCLVPFYIAAFTTSSILSPIAAFCAFVGIWSVNEVAIELENPFGSDHNDISCGDFHERFLETLLEQRGAHRAKVKAEEETASSRQVEIGAPLGSLSGEFESATESRAAKSVGSKLTCSSSLGVLAMSGKDVATSPAVDLSGHSLGVDVGTLVFEALKPALTPDVGTLDLGRHLFEISNAIELRLTEILAELKTGCSLARKANAKSITEPKFVQREGSRQASQPSFQRKDSPRSQ